MKTCPYCFEAVHNDAKKCPHCHEWLKKWSRNSPYTIMIPLILLFIAGIGAQEYYSRDIQETLKKTYSPFKPENFEIVSHEEIRGKEDFFIIGQIKNNGPDTDEYIKIEASVYDKSNKLINLGKASFIGGLRADEIRPFKISFNCHGKTEIPNFDHYDLKVRGGL